MERITVVARELPLSLIENVCDAIERVGARKMSEDTRRAIARVATVSGASASIHGLLDDWAALAPRMPPVALAWALRAAATADAWRRAHESLELIWTGPVPPGTRLRRTHEALLGLIQGARESLLMVTFAVYQEPVLRDALLAAHARGVSLRFVLESQKESGGKLSGDPLVALGEELAAAAEFWAWPLETRSRDAKGKHGLLHAKCAVADDDVLFISSANLTGNAMSLNMELGILVKGGGLPDCVLRHFDQMIEAGTIIQTTARRSLEL